MGEELRGNVSLGTPRPEGLRSVNEYIETPLRRQNERAGPTPLVAVSASHLNNNKLDGGGKQHRASTVGVHCRQPAPIKQPPSSLPPLLPQSISGAGGVTPVLQDSIICAECGKCRCDSCRSPRSPPSAWLCSDLCYCSVDSCVDYASCLCCVKGAMYHCGEEPGWADDPCSCSGAGWGPRWACLSIASLILPCLWCYCPLRSAADACSRGYAACTHRGCTCS
ncbi:protein sprouty homolog 3-like [Rhodnius prolixus]|uniref:Sprouty n=2 Tax=Rhodnius TaxID=13248 RepID=T1HA38_RHOPR